MKYKFIGFDLDGTLVNTFPFIISSYKNALKTVYGKIEESDESIKSKIGIPVTEFFKLYPEKDRQTLLDLFLTDNDRSQANGVPFFDGVKEMLYQLKGKVKLGLISSKRKIPLIKWAKKENLYDLFDVIIGKEDTLLNKPDGEPLKRAMELANVEKNETLYVGDARYDVMCTHNAQADACVVGWNAFGKSYFDDLHPEHYAENCKYILNLVEE